MVPFEAFLAEKPVVTTTDAGGPLDVVHDRRDRPRRRADAWTRSPAALAIGEDEARRVGPGGQGARRAGHLGQRDRQAARVKVAYYSPLPPSRSGVADYSALLLPELEQRIDVVVARPGRFRRAPQRTSRSTTSATTRTRTAGSPRRSRARPGVVVLHEFVLHHLVAGLTLARGDARGYLDAMERGHGLAGRLLAYGVIDSRIPPLWETRPEAFPLAGDVLAAATGLIVHSRVRRGARPRRRLRRAGLADPASRPGRCPPSSPAAGRGQPADRLLRPPEREQAHPAAPGRVRAAPRRATRGAAPARRRARRRG